MAKKKEVAIDTTSKEEKKTATKVTTKKVKEKKITADASKKEEKTTAKATTKKVKEEKATADTSKKKEKKTAKATTEKVKEGKTTVDANKKKKKETTKKIKEEKQKIDTTIEIEKQPEEANIAKKEELVSIKKIEETIKEKQNLPKEEIEKINKYIFQNILVAICILIYFIFLNLGYRNIQSDVYATDLKVFSMCALFLAIALIENAYKKDDGRIAIYGIEMIVVSLITTALIYVQLMLAERYTYIVTSISYIFAIYYLIKSIIIYLKKRKKYFVDDMKKMIQDKED